MEEPRKFYIPRREGHASDPAVMRSELGEVATDGVVSASAHGSKSKPWPGEHKITSKRD